MLKDSKAFNGYSLTDVDRSREFYEGTLGLEVTEEMGGLGLNLATGGQVFIYPKEDHEPARFTVLNFPVEDIEAAVDALVEKGVEFERYEGFDQDERGIMNSSGEQEGPKIAWFTDPDGNILSVLE